MRLTVLLLQTFRFLSVPAVLFTIYIYYYPALHDCSFPPAKRAQAASHADAQTARPAVIAPFRLLALGDPQLEGDTSLPKRNAPAFPHLQSLREQFEDGQLVDAPREVLATAVALVTKDVPSLLQGYRKRLDLLGNDYYLAHVYRLVRWWTQPTHTVVLGDLLGSQWIDDEEFLRRAHRFWDRVFVGQEKVPDSVAEIPATTTMHLPDEATGESQYGAWSKRLINVVGNHDIGYAGDINEKRIARFEEVFGKVNWDTRFKLPSDLSQKPNAAAVDHPRTPGELRVIVLNSMNLDSPAWRTEIQDVSHRYLAEKIAETSDLRSEDATVLLTHVPLFKTGGLCADGPFFAHFSDDQGGGISEQNHLSEESSQRILDGLFPAKEEGGARGVILNGHDHEGCDIYHLQLPPGVEQIASSNSSIGDWTSAQHLWARGNVLDKERHGIREITVRSMMGSYGGNAGLLSAWFDEDLQEWKFDYDSCVFGVQHIWWAVHGFDIVVALIGLATIPIALIEFRLEKAKKQERAVIGEKKNI